MSRLSLNFIRRRLESNRQLLEACERPEGRLAESYRQAIARDEATLRGDKRERKAGTG